MYSEQEQLQILAERYARLGYCTAVSAYPREIGEVVPNVISGYIPLNYGRILSPASREEHLKQAESIGFPADQMPENGFFYRIEICD